jgi:hypothetical protein
MAVVEDVEDVVVVDNNNIARICELLPCALRLHHHTFDFTGNMDYHRMDIFHQHFNSQKNAMNLIKEKTLNLMAIPLKIQLEAKVHKTNSDKALQLDGIELID